MTAAVCHMNGTLPVCIPTPCRRETLLSALILGRLSFVARRLRLFTPAMRAEAERPLGDRPMAGTVSVVGARRASIVRRPRLDNARLGQPLARRRPALEHNLGLRWNFVLILFSSARRTALGDDSRS